MLEAGDEHGVMAKSNWIGRASKADDWAANECVWLRALLPRHMWAKRDWDKPPESPPPPLVLGQFAEAAALAGRG